MASVDEDGRGNVGHDGHARTGNISLHKERFGIAGGAAGNGVCVDALVAAENNILGGIPGVVRECAGVDGVVAIDVEGHHGEHAE